MTLTGWILTNLVYLYFWWNTIWYLFAAADYFFWKFQKYLFGNSSLLLIGIFWKFIFLWTYLSAGHCAVLLVFIFDTSSVLRPTFLEFHFWKREISFLEREISFLEKGDLIFGKGRSHFWKCCLHIWK